MLFLPLAFATLLASVTAVVRPVDGALQIIINNAPTTFTTTTTRTRYEIQMVTKTTTRNTASYPGPTGAPDVEVTPNWNEAQCQDCRARSGRQGSESEWYIDVLSAPSRPLADMP